MTISNVVRLHLKNKPYVIEAMEKGIVNSSSLARSVQRELGLKPGSYHAVKAAIRRYMETLEKTRGDIEENALRVLKGNMVTLMDKITVVVSSEKLNWESIAEVKVGRYYIYIFDEIQKQSLRRPDRKGKLIEVHGNYSAIRIHSNNNIENTPGVIAFLTSVLAEHQINIAELISCYTETIMVVKKDYALPAYQIVSEIVK